MDDDIDNELLALAGGASSDEEDDTPVNHSARSASPDGKKAGKASGGRKAGGRATGRRQNDSEEEGEASSTPSSPNSEQSAPMDESDSESDAAPAFDDEGDRYPLEGKFINNADKDKIMAMPEINREELLAERAQHVERERQTRALRQLLNAREAETKKQDKKRKAGAADLDDNRKTSRQRTKLGGGKVGEASAGIDSLKRARAEKTDRQRRRDEDKERYKDRRADDHSDLDADRDSNLEWDELKKKKKSKSPEYRDAQPADLQDIERIRVGRTRFAQVCFYPGMEEALIGCFTRVVVGKDEATGQNIYRMGYIKGFTDGQPYAITNENNKTFVTSQYVIATIGKAQRSWPFIVCSDSKITDAEWSRYTKTCQFEGLPVPLKPKCIQKIHDINRLINRSWTEAELQEKLTRSGALQSKFVPIERNRLNNLLAEAKARGDVQGEAAIREELQKLQGPKLAFNTSLDQSPKKATEAPVMSQQDRIALLNKQNRKKNIEEVRQAQIAERRKAKMIEAALARGEDVVEDTSRRVKTRAKVNYDVSEIGGGPKKTESGTATPSADTPTASVDKSAASIIAKLQAANTEKKGIATIRRPIMDDDIIGAIDFGIDLDLGL